MAGMRYRTGAIFAVVVFTLGVTAAVATGWENTGGTKEKVTHDGKGKDKGGKDDDGKSKSKDDTDKGKSGDKDQGDRDKEKGKGKEDRDKDDEDKDNGDKDEPTVTTPSAPPAPTTQVQTTPSSPVTPLSPQATPSEPGDGDEPVAQAPPEEDEAAEPELAPAAERTKLAETGLHPGFDRFARSIPRGRGRAALPQGVRPLGRDSQGGETEHVATGWSTRVRLARERARELLQPIVPRSAGTAGARSRRATGFAGGLAIFLGFALMADAVATVVWQDPITAVFAQQRQKALDRQLTAIERTPVNSSTLGLVKNAITKEKRMALLAEDLRRRSKAGDPLGRISIPRIDKKFVFVGGTGLDSLKEGPGHYAGTWLPGQKGTIGIAGHRTTYLAPFRHIDRLRSRDRIVMTMPYGRFTYRVESTQVVSPSRTSVLRSVGHDRLVLTTCTPPHSAKRRLIVMARLDGATARGPTIPQTALPPVSPL